MNPGRRRNMQAIRRRDTKPELRLRSILHARGLRYRVDFSPLPSTRWKADVVFTRAKVAVFIDGCYWHQCPDHSKPPSRNVDYWLPKLERNVSRDREFDKRLRESGWTVIRAWEHEDPASIANLVEAAVRTA
ncbi:very short patch repair endonuclease [Nocardioides sp. NPDC057577]|uniref:very short patch repair endonuclease n=1 Tax=Nocardioides sp. NPDC057577 TaxID=3346171 RepID=UPI0036732028